MAGMPCCSCAAVPTLPLPLTGRETGIEVGLQVVPQHGGWADRGEPPPRPARREEAAEGAAARLPSQAGRKAAAPPQGGGLARQGPSDGAAPTGRFPPQDGARAAAAVRHPLSRRRASRQYGAEPPPRQKQLWMLAGRCSVPSSKPRQPAPGGWVVAVPSHDTSQDWSGGGARVPKSLSVRSHACTSCGRVLDRDEHAARNIHMGRAGPSGSRGVGCGAEQCPIWRTTSPR